MDSHTSLSSTVVWTPRMQLHVLAQNSGKLWHMDSLSVWRVQGLKWRDCNLSVGQAEALHWSTTDKSPYVKLHLSHAASQHSVMLTQFGKTLIAHTGFVCCACFSTVRSAFAMVWKNWLRQDKVLHKAGWTATSKSWVQLQQNARCVPPPLTSFLCRTSFSTVPVPH